MSRPRPRVVVHPPTGAGGRRVHVDAEILGIAYSRADLYEFLRRIGLDPDVIELDDPVIDWRGGGPEVWD
ncbi:hypothetical protein [Streptomyces noursei]|uniref:hypothetical protein n=1 Tax=Streptomyces noursei TaxID=1971 RepID=UPI00381AE2D0